MWLCASKKCTTSVAFWSFCSSFWRFTCFLSSSLQPTTFWSGSGHHHRLPYCPHLFPPDSGACIWTSNKSVMWPAHPSARDLNVTAKPALGHSLLWGVDYLQSPKHWCYTSVTIGFTASSNVPPLGSVVGLWDAPPRGFVDVRMHLGRDGPRGQETND